MKDFLTLDFEEILDKVDPKEDTAQKAEQTDPEIQEGVDPEVKPETEIEDAQDDGNVKDTGSEDVPETKETKETEFQPDQVKELYKVVSSVLPLDENDEPTPEWIEEQINDAPRKLVDIAIKNMPQDAQTVLGYIANKPDFTMKDLVEYTKQYVPNEIDVESAQGARDYLKSNPAFTKLYDGEELEEELDRLEDNDKLVAKAKRLKEADDVKKVEGATKLAQETKAQEEQRLAQQKDFAKQIRQEVDSLQWQESTKQEIFENLKKERVQFVNSKLQNNPKAVVQMAHIYSFFDEENDFDELFSKLEGRESSKKAQQTKDKLQKSKLSGLVKTVAQPHTKKEIKGWVPEI